MASRDTISPPSLYQRENERRRVVGKVNRTITKDTNRAKIIDRMDAERLGLIAAGAPVGSMPALNNRMSPAQIAQAQARINDAKAQRPDFNGFASPGVGRRTGSPLPAPAGSTSDAGPLASIPPVQLRGSSPAEIQSAAGGGATGVAVARQNTADAETKAAAGTATKVQTPYGPVSSRTVKTGVPEAEATVTDTGVTREPAEPWDVQLVKKYPAIGVAGSPENNAFVENYKKASKSSGDAFDPAVEGHRIADQMFAVNEGESVLSPQADLPGVDATRKPAKIATKEPTYTPNSPAAKAAEARRSAQAGVSEVQTDFQRKIGVPVANAVNTGLNIYRGLVGEPEVPDFATPEFDNPKPSTATHPPAQQLEPLDYTAFASMPPSTVDVSAPPVAVPSGFAYNAPAIPNATASNSSSAPEFTGYQDPDVAAFAGNPSDDEFRKKLREPVTYSYSN